jgi:SAM-dependent methyltransferase
VNESSCWHDDSVAREANTASKLTFCFPGNFHPDNDRVLKMLSGYAHYRQADRPLFISAYNELCRVNLNGARILEVCCGMGDLAREVARAFPGAEVIGLDRYSDSGHAIREARSKEGLKNVNYHRGNALRLAEFSDSSLDLVYGQATLHHLANDLDAVREEFSRVLKPGGRLIFIYEPLGHNYLWSMVRACQVTRGHMGDESNLFLDSLEDIARNFSRCEVHVFNLLGYPVKALGRLASWPLVNLVARLDAALMRRSRGLARLGANFNAVFYK